ncbi:DUF1127 domain-containing protein [Harenicola maris]
MSNVSSNTACTYTAAPKRRSVLATIAHWFRVYQTRQTLKALDLHSLEDIGISPAEARKEAQRPLWDAPRHWS